MNKDGKTLFRNNYAWNNGDKTLRLFTPDIYFFHLLYIIKYVMSIKKRKKKKKKSMLCLQTIFVCSGKRDILGIQRGWGFGTQVQLRTISLMVTNSMIKINIPFLIKWLERFPQY